MSFVSGLVCRECERKYPVEPLHVCEFCFGPLEVAYDYASMKKAVTREKITSGPFSIWRYKDLLPVDGVDPVDLKSGFSPLIRADNLAEEIGLDDLYIKNDTINPTFSFKDRVVSVALTKAVEFGFETVSCASTGNLANSVAAHAAHAGLKAYIFIPADLEKGKVIGSAVYDPTLVGVKGSYDDVNRLCSEIAGEFNWAFVNINVRPYYAEGSKTLGYETAEQLGWRAPDHVVVPVASGSLLTKVQKGLQEFYKLGLMDRPRTKISGAQAEGCAPVVQAFEEDTLDIRPVKPHTIAKSLAIGNPADGYYALNTVKETGGSLAAVSDQELTDAVKLLARTEGIFGETAGGVTIGVLKKLVETGKIGRDEEVVAYVTGIGLKTLEAVEESLPAPTLISPSLDAFKQGVLG
ncbi:MAG: threonine synthase [Terriglobia bacterium]